MRRLTGSITVFLSLVFLLVFALFGTLLETARYTVCKNHAARTLRTGAEGLLSEYNRPLYEHYGLFFIEKGGTPYEQVIGRYAGDTISAADKGEMDFLDGGVDAVGGWHYGDGRYDNLRAGICKDVRYRRVQGAEFWCH